MMLSKEEWNQLDSLLSKLGFGGYYDFMELMRMTAYNLIDRMENKEIQKSFKDTIRTEKDLRTLTTLVNFLSKENKL